MPSRADKLLPTTTVRTTFALQSRHLFLYTTRYAPRLQSLDLADQLNQFSHPEQRASRRHGLKPINPARIGPTRELEVGSDVRKLSCRRRRVTAPPSNHKPSSLRQRNCGRGCDRRFGRMAMASVRRRVRGWLTDVIG